MKSLTFDTYNSGLWLVALGFSCLLQYNDYLLHYLRMCAVLKSQFVGVCMSYTQLDVCIVPVIC